MEPEDYDYVPSVFDAAAAEAAAPRDATRGQRLLNFIVDGGACLLLFYPAGYLISAALYRFGVDIFSAVARPLQSWPAALALLLLIAAAYFFVMEAATRGRSLGKWITGTIAVRDDGQALTPPDVFARTLCRLIPFEPFSSFSDKGPWHDRFSKTRVVRFRKAINRDPILLPDSSANYDVKQ